MDMRVVEEDVVTVFLDTVAVDVALPNDRLLSMTRMEVWEFFAPHMLPLKWDEDTKWLMFEDILGGYFDRQRELFGRRKLSSRDTESTVAMKGG